MEKLIIDLIDDEMIALKHDLAYASLDTEEADFAKRQYQRLHLIRIRLVLARVLNMRALNAKPA